MGWSPGPRSETRCVLTPSLCRGTRTVTHTVMPTCTGTQMGEEFWGSTAEELWAAWTAFWGLCR